MDDETKLAFAGMLKAINGLEESIDARFTAVNAQLLAGMARMNDGFEHVLNEIGTLRSDFQNTKGFLLEDSSVMGRRTLSIEERLTRLERKH